jgi:hypothetical protein
MPTSFQCKFCAQPFPTVAGEKRHIQQTPDCLAKWQEELTKLSIHVFDLQQDDSPDVTQDERQPAGSFADDLPSNFDDFDRSEGACGTETPTADPPSPCRAELGSRTTVEEVEDEGDPVTPDVTFVEGYPNDAYAGAAYERADLKFEKIKQAEMVEGDSERRWGPFADEEEWELAEWLIHNVGQKQTDTFLKLPIVQICPSSFDCWLNGVNSTESIRKHHTRTIVASSRRLMPFQHKGLNGSVTLLLQQETKSVRAASQ